MQLQYIAQWRPNEVMNGTVENTWRHGVWVGNYQGI